MKVVYKPSQLVFYDKKVTRSINIMRNLPLITWLILVFVLVVFSLLGMIPIDGAVGTVIVIMFIPSLLAFELVGKAIRMRILSKYRDYFFNDLTVEGFTCDAFLDSGSACYDITSNNNSLEYVSHTTPAVIAVDHSRRMVAIMFYRNPTEHYLFSADVINEIISGKDYKYMVSASLTFSVECIRIIIPTKIWYSKIRGESNKVETCKHEEYESGKVSKKFRKAVERADDFANVLKNLTAIN